MLGAIQRVTAAKHELLRNCRTRVDRGIAPAFNGLPHGKRDAAAFVHPIFQLRLGMRSVTALIRRVHRFPAHSVIAPAPGCPPVEKNAFEMQQAEAVPGI